jgi:hypothetical protein
VAYTHYWHHARDVAPGEWANILADFRTLIHNLPEFSTSAGDHFACRRLRLAAPDGRPRSQPQLSSERIAFNGVAYARHDLSHEPMILERARASESDPGEPPEHPFRFCKTARKPYDLAVCALLIVVERRTTGAYLIESDGDVGDWRPALAWVDDLLGAGYALPPRVAAKGGAP